MFAITISDDFVWLVVAVLVYTFLIHLVREAAEEVRNKKK